VVWKKALSGGGVEGALSGSSTKLNVGKNSGGSTTRKGLNVRKNSGGSTRTGLAEEGGTAVVSTRTGLAEEGGTAVVSTCAEQDTESRAASSFHFSRFRSLAATQVAFHHGSSLATGVARGLMDS